MSRRVLFLGFLLASLVSTSAAPPAWWASRGATDTNPPNDDSAVNQGQLKQFTQKAVQELNARIPGGAGADLNSLVNGWGQAYRAGGYNATNPLPTDFEAMNSGQLKWIANKVHARLVFAKYEDAVPAWLAQNPAADNQLVNLGQLKTVFNFDLTAPTGQLPEWWQKFYFNGQTGIDPNGDPDGDGLTTAQEQALGTKPDDPDSDDDVLNDSEDAVPLDSEINWRKTPESKYVWIEQIVLPTDNSGQLIAPVAVNKSGQILFPYYTAGEDGSSTDPPRNQLWDSAARQWTNLPYSGSQVIQIEAGLTFTADDQAGGFIDINDAGTVSGLARGGQRSPDTSVVGAHEISGTQAAMIWEKTGTPPAYGPPKYSIYHHTHPITSCPDCGSDFRNLCWSELDIGSHAGTKYRWRNWRVPGGRIGMDGSINLCANIIGSSYNLSPVWLLRDGATTSPILGAEIKHFGASQLDYLAQLGNGTAFAGAILDKNRALFVETYGAASASTLWLKDGVSVETIATIVPSLSSDQTDIILAPSKKNDNTDRLWIAAGSKVLLEKLAGGSGANRWSEPTSMGQGAIRLNSSGLAITAGTPAQGTVAAILPKLWRNGLYTDLNEMVSKPTTVTITEAIDLASNGIILVKAKEGAANKTGILMPIRVTGVNASISPVNLDAPDRGVDNISILADDRSGNGHQAEYWVMAPISNTNTVRFLTAASQALPVELSATNATFNPTILTSPDQQVIVTGTGTATSDAQLKLKIGTQEVQSPIGVKAMKKRNVKVTIHAVGLNVVPPETPVIPALGVIQTYLNSVFLHQLNAEITVTPGINEAPLGWDMGRASIFKLSGPGSEKLHEGNGTFDFTEADKLEQEDEYINSVLRDERADINVYVLTRHLLGWYAKDPGAGSLSGAVGMTRREPRVILIDGKQNEIITTIAHEIGHCMIGFGHPNPNPLAIAFAKLAGKPPPPRGPAPHDGVGTDEWKKRLMYSTTLPAPGKTMVKSEWDTAETWLTGLPYGRSTP